jgi:hypothetical protein
MFWIQHDLILFFNHALRRSTLADRRDKVSLHRLRVTQCLPIKGFVRANPDVSDTQNPISLGDKSNSVNLGKTLIFDSGKTLRQTEGKPSDRRKRNATLEG